MPPQSHTFDSSSTLPPSPTSHQLLRIIHVIHSLDPAERGSAAVPRLAAAQASLGHEVTIVSTLAASAHPDFNRSIQFVPAFERVRLLLSPWTRSPQHWFGKRFTPILRNLLPTADVVHLHGISGALLRVAATEARRARIPYIVHPAGSLNAWSVTNNDQVYIPLRPTHRRILDRAAAIHLLNPDVSRIISPLKLVPPRHIIPSGIFLEEVDAPDEGNAGVKQFHTAAPNLGKRPFILFVGRLDQSKGLDLLANAFIEIAKDHSHIDLVVIGPRGDAEESFRETLRIFGLNNRVHITGPLYGPAKFYAYRNAHCFCLPSRHEASNLAIIEALASRTPVAISTNCHFQQVADTGAGLTFPLEQPAVTQALYTLLNASPRECEQMGAAARSLVESNFTWPKIAPQTLTLYSTLRTNQTTR